MVSLTVRSLLLAIFALFASPAEPPAQSWDKVIVVDLNIDSPSEAEKCYLTTYDNKRVEIQVEIDDTLNTLPDFVFEEDPLEGPDCFMPEMKLIYYDYTYVVSLYCTKVKKYKNDTPFQPSNKQIKNDLAITESVLDYLKKIRKTYFTDSYDPQKVSKFVRHEALPGDEKVDDSFLLKDEDDDADLRDAATDKEGWFDNIERPDEKIVIDEDDDGGN